VDRQEAPVAEALQSFRAQADLARSELARAAYLPASGGLTAERLATIVRLEGYFEGYFEALKLAPPALAEKCVPEARALLQDLTAILLTAG
jgi:hypothetical protein